MQTISYANYAAAAYSNKPETLYYILCMLQISYCSNCIPVLQKYHSNCYVTVYGAESELLRHLASKSVSTTYQLCDRRQIT